MGVSVANGSCVVLQWYSVGSRHGRLLLCVLCCKERVEVGGEDSYLPASKISLPDLC